jgi:PTS system nitrogen regulatory IIA component
MNLEEIVNPNNVLSNVSARSKKHCLEILSELLTRSNPDIASEEVFAKLVERERLGCTCLEKGIAFPRCRISGLQSSYAALMRLTDPVDFNSISGESVDLVFGLMVPEHLSDADNADVKALLEILRDPTLCARLRAATNSTDLSAALLTGQLEPVPSSTSRNAASRGASKQ